MRLLTVCPVCNKRRLMTKKRTYKHRVAGIIVSQSEQCRKCYNNIRKMIATQ